MGLDAFANWFPDMFINIIAEIQLQRAYKSKRKARYIFENILAPKRRSGYTVASFHWK